MKTAKHAKGTKRKVKKQWELRLYVAGMTERAILILPECPCSLGA